MHQPPLRGRPALVGKKVLLVDPLCSVCNEPVDLTAKTNEEGKTIHEECYLTQMKGSVPTATANPSNEIT
jgi:hypothetical protein